MIKGRILVGHALQNDLKVFFESSEEIQLHKPNNIVDFLHFEILVCFAASHLVG